MDHLQYHPNTMTTSTSQYNSLPGMVSPHQLQQQNLPQHTLPPLQPQHAAIQSIYNSAPHTPRTPGTPNTPTSAHASGTFPQLGAQSRNYAMMTTNGYPQRSQSFPNPSVTISQTSNAMTQSQPIAPAPNQNRVQQQRLRPMPPASQHMMSAMSSPYAQSGMLAQSPILSEHEPPTHVVGSQGRRGILPSAPGRQPVTATGAGATKSAMIPAKDADGKFPCPHCTKTYLHAKHLKRHLLRHTGDRPYMCVLCRDTFSRSDILQRHFQKCSIRRGNPTGASHLSHAQAHLKKSHPGANKGTSSVATDNDIIGVSGMHNMNNNGGVQFSVVSEGHDNANLTDQQAQHEHHLSRSNSMKHVNITNGSGGRDGRSIPGPVQGNATRSTMDQGYTTGMPTTMSSGMTSSMAYSLPNAQSNPTYSQNYDFSPHSNNTHMSQQHTQDASTSSGQSPMSVYAGANAGQQQSGVDWSHMFQSGTQPGGQGNFISTYNNSMANSQMPVKEEKR